MADEGGKSSRSQLSYNFSDKKHLRFLVPCYNLYTLLETRCKLNEDRKSRRKEGNLYRIPCKILRASWHVRCLSFANRCFLRRKTVLSSYCSRKRVHRAVPLTIGFTNFSLRSGKMVLKLSKISKLRIGRTNRIRLENLKPSHFDEIFIQF